MSSKIKSFLISVLSLIASTCAILSAVLLYVYFTDNRLNIASDVQINIAEDSVNNFIVSNNDSCGLISLSKVKHLTAANVSSTDYISTATVSATLADEIADEDVTFSFAWADTGITDSIGDYVGFTSTSGSANSYVAASEEEVTIYCYKEFSNQIMLTASVDVDGEVYSSDCTVDYLARVTSIDLTGGEVGGNSSNSLASDSTLSDDYTLTYGTGSVQDEISYMTVTITFADDVKDTLEEYFGVTDWSYTWDMSSDITMDDLFADVYGIGVSEVYTVLKNYSVADTSVFVITFNIETLSIGKTYSLSYELSFDASGYAVTDINNYLTFTGEDKFTNLALSNVSTCSVNVLISDDGINWGLWNGSSYDVTNSTVYVCGYNNSSFSISYNYACCFSGSFTDCSGSIMSLLDYSDLDCAITSDYCFARLFEGCGYLVNAPELSATTLSPHCYQDMFTNCPRLTEAPELPATTLATYCYYRMFWYCYSLTEAPELPATTLATYCYSHMFYYCTSLVSAPALPATTLAANCYNHMFYYCTSLVNAPDLPAINLKSDCYYGMFVSCTSLIDAPELPATSTASYCYGFMFYNCTSLVSAPALPATASAANCYNYMFWNCTSLVNAPELPSTSVGSESYSHMFDGCISLIVAPELPATTLDTYCYSYMFYGCTSLTFAPELPATTLNFKCYSSMFCGCTSLTVAPELPATKLSNYCYEYMFSGCTSLEVIPSLSHVTSFGSNSCCYMFNSCTKVCVSEDSGYGTLLIITGDTESCFSNMFRSTGGDFTGTPSTNASYYTSNVVIYADGTRSDGTNI